jgi:hypothetical protein
MTVPITRRVWLPGMAVAAAIAAGTGLIGVSSAMAAGPAVASPRAASPSPAGPRAPAADNTAPCSFKKVSACQSTDPTVKTYVKFGPGSFTGCTFDISVDWGDGSKPTQVFFTSPNDGVFFLAAHTYAYSDSDMTFTITITGQVTAGGCGFNPFVDSFALLTCTSSELSGPSWAGRFPDSSSVGALSGTFRKDVSAFIAAMRHAGITVRPISTLRLTERTYLMHFSWLVAKRKLSALHVPRFRADKQHRPVSICWVHVGAHGANLRASIAAAGKLAAALGVASQRSAPALTSLRTEGLSIDMSTTWTARRITIVNAAGHRVTIHSTPHNGLNKTLIAVGATYAVIHFLNAARAMNVWSVNGH